MDEKVFDLIAIGNAIVDVLINVDESFLIKNSLHKGSMTLIDENKAKELYLGSTAALETSGGSAANTAAGILNLGSSANFIGRVKEDKLGKVFRDDICQTGAGFNTSLLKEGPSTGRCLIYVTPDAERTMCTYLGCSILLNEKDIDFSILTKAKLLYLEGYLWDLDEAKNAFKTAAIECRKNGVKVALSLSDIFCIERNRESFQALLEEHVDILFANENEIIALYQSSSFDSAVTNIKEKCELAVLTRGSKGSLILSNGREYSIKSYNFGKTIDTTGAGDLYASGFLHGYINNKDLLTCGKFGSICAGHIVTQLGSRSKASLKKLINEN